MEDDMKKLGLRLLLGLAFGVAALSAAPALAISYYDDFGRAYYFNNWGQKIYYDTGYNDSVVEENRTYSYYYPAPQVDRSTTTTIERGPGMTARTVTYTSAVPAATCREYNYSVRVNGQMQSTTGTECLQPDGSWIRQ
jgi:hypothetical protein